MKRKDAFHKLCVICQRLDEVDPEQFFVIPLRLYLFGSLLTDKPNPSDVDLLFAYRDPPNLDPADIVYRMTYGKPLPHEQAFKHLRRGMKMIRIASLRQRRDLDGGALPLPGYAGKIGLGARVGLAGGCR